MSVKTYALTTRARLMDFMGVSSVTETQGNVLDRIIDSVTEYIENYCGFRFKKTTYTDEVYDGDGSGMLNLKNFPLVSGESFSLSYRNSVLNEGSYTAVSDNSFRVDNASGVVYGMGGYTFTSGRGLYKATYTAGYDFDNATTFLSDTTAGAIEYACWKLCASAYNNRKQSQGVQSERLGDYAVSYNKTTYEDPEIKGILDQYARLDVGGTFTGSLY